MQVIRIIVMIEPLFPGSRYNLTKIEINLKNLLNVNSMFALYVSVSIKVT